jgi:hypothetical protein
MRGMMGRVAGAIFAATLAGQVMGVAVAETHTETIVSEQRTSVSVRITPEAAQSLLPAGWTPSGAEPTLSLIFMDRKLALAPDGKPLGAGVNRLLVMSLGARNAATGEARGLIVGGYSTDPTGVPGAYNVYAHGVVDVARSERTAGIASDIVEEHWTVKAADGGVLDVRVAFARGVPALGEFELKVHSGADPAFYRIYRGEQATDVVRNASGVDRVQSVTVTASGGRLGEIVATGAQVMSVSNAPYYMRETFLP